MGFPAGDGGEVAGGQPRSIIPASRPAWRGSRGDFPRRKAASAHGGLRYRPFLAAFGRSTMPALNRQRLERCEAHPPKRDRRLL